MPTPQPVFVPGVGSTAQLFARQSEVFEDARIHALPGQEGDGAEPLDDVGAHARHLLDRLDPSGDPPVLVGHGLGAAIALGAALAAPGRVAGLVLICLGDRGAPGDDWQPDGADERRARVVARATGERPAAWIAPWERDLARIPARVLAAGGRAARSVDHRAELSRIAVPGLVIAALEDRTTAPDAAERLARSLPGALMVAIADCGELAPLERPDPINLAIAGYLARLEVTGLDT